MAQTLFDEVGGIKCLQKVHKIFYDKVYAHDWLGKFFEGHDQAAIENRQTGFMAEKMGCATPYAGKEIRMVHEAMYITRELADLRHALLAESLREAGLSDALAERWLKIDQGFMNLVIKDSVEAMYDNDWKFKKPIIIPRPAR